MLLALEALDDDALAASVFMLGRCEAPAVVLARYCRSVAASSLDRARDTILAMLADPSLITDQNIDSARKGMANVRSYQANAERFARSADGRPA